jgi:protein TonB
MAPAFNQSFSDGSSISLRRRPVPLLMTLIIHVLLVIMFFRLAPNAPPTVQMRSKPLTVQLLPAQRESPAARPRSVAKTKSVTRGAALRLPPRPVKPPVIPKAKPVEPSQPLVEVIPLTRAELASIDFNLSRSSQGKSADAGTGSAGRGSQGDTPFADGEGPGGERLYYADWYRKPTSAELSGYLPPGPRKTGWGMIACQMVENYRVENCRALGQSPGSGLSRAVLNAAWQFRVRPPSIGGRAIMRAWVRIRIEFSEGGVE